jgi:PAS domain S-box-containing protein
MIRYISLILFLFFTAEAAYCQKYNFSNYPLGEGYQNSQITDIIQDKEGILWIATLAGVVSFDGIRFTDISKKTGFENTPVKCLFQDSKGNIWISVLRKGVYKYNKKEWTLYTTKDGLLSNIINTVCEDESGAVWIGTNLGLNRIFDDKIDSYTIDNGLVNNNIFKLYKGKNKLWIGTVNGISYLENNEFKILGDESQRLRNPVVYSLYEDEKENLWIGTNAGLILYQPTTGLTKMEYPGFDNSRITGIVKDSKGKFWFATYGQGAFAYDGNTFRHYSEINGLSSNIILALIHDQEGNMWFGTANGLSRFSGEMFVTYSREYDLANDNILSTCTDKDGNIWFGSVGRGIIKYDADNTFKKFGPAEGMVNNTIWSIYEKDNLYIGTNEGYAIYDKRKNKFIWAANILRNNTVYAIIKDKNDNLWLGTDRGIFVVEGKKIQQYDRFKGLANESVRVLYEDQEGSIWIGTLGGIFYWDGDTINDFSKQQKLGKRTVTSIIEDKSGNIIFGIYDEGIRVLDKTLDAVGKKPPVRLINSRSGLQGEKVLSLYLDDYENLWVGTSNGIESIRWPEYLRNSQLIGKKYNSSDGYFGMECNSISQDAKGNLWFGTVNGIVEFRPGEKINDKARPKPRILNVLLFNEPVELSTEDEDSSNTISANTAFKHNENFISFEFSATYLTSPEFLEFQYKLEGYDKDWSQVARTRSVYYADLLPGDYIFRVRAAEKGENWSDPASFAFTVSSPVWQTPAAYALYVFVCIGLILIFISLRTRNLRKSRNTLSKRVEERTHELQEKTAELERLSIVAKETGNAVMIFNSQKQLEWLNDGFTTLTGFNKEELVARYGTSLENLCFNPDLKTQIEDSVKARKSIIYEGKLTTRNGKPIWISTTLTPIYNGVDTLKNVVLIHSDITYRKEMEESIKDSLGEKQKLLREIHHRVKNNLQIIISLLNLQSSYISDYEALKALKEGQDRVKSLALIHEKIYQSDELSDIEFKEYIKKLLEHLYFSYNIDKEDIMINIQADDVLLDIDTAVPCGLIINELVTNALKYAFEGRKKGAIYISLEAVDENCYKLCVSDNGVGMPAGFDVYHSETLGMQLLTALVDQLDGKIELVNSNGVNFTIYFKRPGVQ